LLVERVQAGRPVAHISAELGISRATGHKWVRRYHHEGDSGLHDRSSRPHLSPARVPARIEQQIIDLRRTRRLGPARIAGILHLHASTVHRVLTRHHMPKLAWLDRPTGQPIRRYERDRPGELLHVDVKKLGQLRECGEVLFMSESCIVVGLSFSWPDKTPVSLGLSRPPKGSVTAEDLLGYPPQEPPLTGELTVAEVVGVVPICRELEAAESGDVGEEHLAAIIQFDRLGLGGVGLARHLSTLSDRLIVTLGLAARLLGHPETQEFPHVRVRAARRASNAQRNLDSTGLPKVFAGTMKRNAQKSAGKAEGTHTAHVRAAKDRLDRPERAFRSEPRIRSQPLRIAFPSERTLYRGEDLRPACRDTLARGGHG
jgi:hypothetical protein